MNTAEKSITVNLENYDSHRIGASIQGDEPLEELHRRLDVYLIGRVVKLGKLTGKKGWTRAAVAKRFGLEDEQPRVDDVDPLA